MAEKRDGYTVRQAVIIAAFVSIGMGVAVAVLEAVTGHG